MNIIVCIDDNNGMVFNKRRVSSDEAVIRRIVENVSSGRFWLNSYSEKLFDGQNLHFLVAEDFLSKAGEEDYCFVENLDIDGYLNKVKKIIIYHWNRKYPSDLKFPLDIVKKNFKLSASYDFVGKSHPNITEEIYEL